MPWDVAVSPPSTGRSTPVTNALASEVSHTTASPMSRGRPIRPRGSFAAYACQSRPAKSALPTLMSVSIGPGHTEFTRMPSGPSSTAAAFVMPRTPNLLAA